MNIVTRYDFRETVAWKLLNLCIQRKILLSTTGVVFYVWQRDDRLVVAFDPNAIDTNLVNDDFAHRLSTRLEGRLVVRTNSRGIFLQVDLSIPPAPQALDAKPLDLTQQPTPWHLPIGITKDGPLWISLIDGDSFLVGGSRRKGKSGLTHGMIQALLHGGRTQVYAWDGKGGVEFGRYIGQTNFHFVSNAQSGLNDLSEILDKRLSQLRASGYANIIEHNEAGKDFIQPIALFVDEIAQLPEPLKETLKEMIELYGASGLYPVLATNDPTKASTLVKSNLSTRICFAVPSFQDSLTVLGMKGAEALTERGRGLIIWDSKLNEFQTFQVSYPAPSDEQRKMLAEQLTVGSGQLAVVTEQPSVTYEDPKADEKKKIIDAYLEYVSRDQKPVWAEIERQVYGQVRGGSYHHFIKKVVAEFEGTTTTTPTPPVLGLEGT